MEGGGGRGDEGGEINEEDQCKLSYQVCSWTPVAPFSKPRGVGLRWQHSQDTGRGYGMGWTKVRRRGMQHLDCLLFSFKLLEILRGDNLRFSKCFTALFSLPHHRQRFNSKAAQVIFHLLIFLNSFFCIRFLKTSFHNGWTGITVSVHETFPFVLCPL